MRIVYLSASSIPSRAANSIHVMRMCQAFVKNGHEVVLMAPRRGDAMCDVDDAFSFYGVEKGFVINRLPWLSVKGKHYTYGYWAATKAKSMRPDLVYGRNLIACFFASLMKMPVVFESHAPADNGGCMLKWMFRRLIRCANFQRLVVITHSLKEYYLARYPFLTRRICVAPDGADFVSESRIPVELPRRSERLQVGYTGHLYPGRGIEVIEELARVCAWADFHIVGGTDQDIHAVRSRTQSLTNFFIHGFKRPAEADRYRLAADVLVAPYQRRVSVYGGGNGGLDTVKWMSPLKLFEYMAAGKAILCSNLPVIREVLSDNATAILVPPDDIHAWSKALLSLRDDSEFRTELGRAARAEFLARYTWEHRADSVLSGLS